MANNFLKYTGLTYDEIIRQVTDKLNSDERFANFRESAIAQTLVEIFAGTVDIVNFYLERRAEESFFDTAKLRSSVLLLARSLGYVIQRPIPAEARIKLKIKGALDLDANSTIQIPVHSVFSYNGLNFILKKTLTLNSSDYYSIVQAENSETDFITKDFNGDYIEIIQGEIKEKVIDGTTNPQVGSTFQIYRIEDTEFSNRYGEEDYEYPVTKVWVGNVKSDSTEYDINRRSLIDWNVIDAATNNTVQNVCVLRTAITEGVELLFGDGRFAQMGASTSGQYPITLNDDVFIQYLATKGAEANQVGVKDKKLQFSGKVLDSNGSDITGNIEFYFESNITGGSDMEDIESIRVNAPNIYYTLDRLVSQRDYVNYLKSLTSPINVKNAIAWGEQEELKERGLEAMMRMFNVVFFSIVGDLYQIDVSPYYVKTKANGLDTSVLDYSYDDDELNARNYFNVFTKGYERNTSNLVQQLKEYNITNFVWKIDGATVDTSKDGNYYSNNYNSGMRINVSYTSDIVANNPSLSATKEITVLGMDALSGYDYATAMQTLALNLTQVLANIDDLRGINIVQNANWNKKAFENITVSFDSDLNKFTITHDLETPAYIYQLEGPFGETPDPVTDMGLTTTLPFLVTQTTELSKNIIDVVDDLDKRSQVTIRNIYISPIIQSMKLTGKVYLKDLYDRQSEKVSIEDEIYSWLNNNADFNKEIYLSNVVELIEQFPSVYYTDIRFVPEVPVNPMGGLFYNGTSHSIIEKQGSNKSTIYDIVNRQLSAYVGSATENDVSGADEKLIQYGSKVNQQYSFEWNPDITERTFLEVFAKNTYNELKRSGLSDFADSQDFIRLISDIRKDYLEIIRYNLIDTKGNIAKDEQIDNSTGKSIKGGYSLGCEITKVNIQLSYEYKR